MGIPMTENTFSRVVACVAATTRYPTELLTNDADLENDLGIDSVKNLEVVLALADEFGLDLATETRDHSVRTIGSVAQWIESLLVRRSRRQSETQELVRGESQPPICNATCEKQDSASHSLPAPHYIRSVPSLEAGSGSAARPSKPLEGRIALVTGSGRGVGRVIARVLASRGAHVIVNSFHSREQGEQTSAEIKAQGGKSDHLWGSVANPNHVERMFTQIEQQFGQLDILVCNASDGRIGPFLELTPDDWERAFRTNVSGHYDCAVKASRLMRSGRGSIITMSAVGASRFIADLGSQGVVKAAVETLTRYLACELGPSGIRVNCVAGGPVYGDLLSKFPAAQATQNHWESITPDGQLCSPLDLANAIGFLVSDEARGINGSVWMVDHGFSANADGRPIRAAAREIAQSLSI